MLIRNAGSPGSGAYVGGDECHRPRVAEASAPDLSERQLHLITSLIDSSLRSNVQARFSELCSRMSQLESAISSRAASSQLADANASLAAGLENLTTITSRCNESVEHSSHLIGNAARTWMDGFTSWDARMTDTNAASLAALAASRESADASQATLSVAQSAAEDTRTLGTVLDSFHSSIGHMSAPLSAA